MTFSRLIAVILVKTYCYYDDLPILLWYVLHPLRAGSNYPGTEKSAGLLNRSLKSSGCTMQKGTGVKPVPFSVHNGYQKTMVHQMCDDSVADEPVAEGCKAGVPTTPAILPQQPPPAGPLAQVHVKTVQDQTAPYSRHLMRATCRSAS